MQKREILESWKEISEYLKRSRRTCLRWEMELDLPIHRLDGTPRARVFAYKDEIDRWLDEKLKSRELSRRRFPFIQAKKTIIVSVSIISFFVLLALGIAIWKLVLNPQATPILSDKPSLAIPFFENNTGEESLEYLRSGLSEWLITDLSQSKYLNVLSGDRMYGILQRLNLTENEKYSSNDLIKIANKGGVTHILKGGYIKVGDHFVITIMLQKPRTGEFIDSFEARCGSEKEIPQKIDELTRQIKTSFNFSDNQIASDIDKIIGQITTNSPRAYEFYMKSREHFSKGNLQDSIVLAEEALKIDPEFASCYELLAAAHLNIGRRAEYKKNIQKALEFSDRASDRERYHITGFYYSNSEKTYNKAFEAFRKLLKLYPDDATGNNMIGYLYDRMGEWDKYVQFAKVNVQNKNPYFLYHYNLADSYMTMGMFDEAKKVLENYQNDFEDLAFIHRALSQLYLYQGELDLALSEAEKVFSLEPNKNYMARKRGTIYYFKGDLEKAEQEFRKLENGGRWDLSSLYLLQGKFEKSLNTLRELHKQIESYGEKSWLAYYYGITAYLYLAAGEPEKALEEYNKEWEIALTNDLPAEQIESMHGKGLVYCAMKSLDEAQKTAAMLRNLIQKGLNKKRMKWFYHLSGMIELEKRNLSRAIEFFKKALPLERYGPLNKPADIIEPLALAYFLDGNLEKAQEEYQKILALTTGREWGGNIYAKSIYMLGKIHEQQGDTAKASEHYEKFLDIWKDADPGFQEVEDARKRLAELSIK